ncbi:MAG: hypothetical protein PHC81_04365, partial [Clostridia bacterium]|nr:hypothetical protein [Clostridia bacterium]
MLDFGEKYTLVMLFEDDDFFNLEDLQVYKQQGKNDDEINSIMGIRLETRNLIEQIAPLENCKVTVYKPRRETMI